MMWGLLWLLRSNMPFISQMSLNNFDVQTAQQK